MSFNDNPHKLEKEIHSTSSASELQGTGFASRITGLNNDYPTGVPQNLIFYEKNIKELYRKLNTQGLTGFAFPDEVDAGFLPKTITGFFNASINPLLPVPLLLETYSDATAGYSLRDIGANGGRVVRVRRDTGGGAGDDDEEDFTAAQVSNGELETFVGAGNDGFVTIWYDQSGNDNDATQTTNNQQPKIVDGGVIVKDPSNEPTISFGTKDNNLTLSTPLGIVNNLNSVSFFMVTQPISALSATQGILTLQPVFANTAFGINVQNDGTNFSYGGILNNNAVMSHVPNLNENVLYSALTEGSNFKGFADGSNILTRDIQDTNVTIAGVIGTFIPGFLSYGGTVSEVIVFDSGKADDRADIEENIANHYNITLS